MGGALIAGTRLEMPQHLARARIESDQITLAYPR